MSDDFDHESRLYGWLLQVVRDKRTDVLWIMSLIKGDDINHVKAREKCQQIITYCNAALSEVDRQQQEWRNENQRKIDAALDRGGARRRMALAKLVEEIRTPLFLQDVHHTDDPSPVVPEYAISSRRLLDDDFPGPTT